MYLLEKKNNLCTVVSDFAPLFLHSQNRYRIFAENKFPETGLNGINFYD